MSSDDESKSDVSSDDDRRVFQQEDLKQDFTISTPSDSEEEENTDHIKDHTLPNKNLPDIQEISTTSESSDDENVQDENDHNSVKDKKIKKTRKPSTSSSESEMDEEEETQITEKLIEGIKSDMKLKTDEDGKQSYVFDINTDSGSGSDNDDKEAEREMMEQIRKLVLRRNGKHNKARRQWLRYEREQKEAEEEAKQFQAYWDRRQEDDRDLWRNKDFANAVDKMSRAGYKGVHGNYDVPEEDIQEFNALYMQITVGDFDGNEDLSCAEEWKKLKGKTRIDCQREFIKKTNKTITKYGWNPPPGWT